ncbi:MAG: type II CRISPR-associated endonuclease Cas1 [Candidatus Hydrogenedentes bacterium]|nr:type II CRISPR-associated endonuclease Cas1 [Candidatus Hydrogenedentota bacterium]
MIKRTIEISGDGNHLSVSQGSLLVHKNGEVLARVPLEDLGVLILDAPNTTYTHSVITDALAAGAVVIPCGRNHNPCGLFLPQDNSLLVQRLSAQVEAPLPLKKTLWKQIVQAKIRSQATALGPECPQRGLLLNLVPNVRSGDPTNVEAHAARIYWPALFGEAFRRLPEGEPPNGLLNYGYMVLRACVARAVCGAGLHPAFGLHHHNRGNPFCLADDLLEPLRPLVDVRVKALVGAGITDVTREAKVQLLTVLTETVETGGEKGPLMVALERVAASLVRCYAREQKKLELPRLWN